MRKCFKFQVLERRNASIESWIRTAKFILKIPIPSEDIKKNVD